MTVVLNHLNIYKMDTTTEQKMTIELSYEQYKHIQSILKQDKPSRTRLTQEEKQFIVNTLYYFLEDHPYADDCGLARSITKKLKV